MRRSSAKANRKSQAGPPPVAQPRFPGWLPAVALVVMTILAYQPVWHAGFIWDDDVYVVTNPLLTARDGLWRIWFSFDSPSQYFPLVYTVFRLEHWLWGLNPAGYHWVNLLLHAANAVLVWRLLARLKVPGAWLAAAIFAVHPVQVESVAWITELKNVLMMFFFLLTLHAWLGFEESNGQKWRSYVLALVFFALSLSAKTTACTLPAALLLILWWQHRPIARRRLVEILPFVVFGIGMGMLTVWWERHHQGTHGEFFALGWLERLLVACRALWFYAGKLFWPTQLAFSYPRWRISATDPFAYGWVLATMILGVMIWRARRRGGRGVEVGVLFFAATLSPVLGFIMLYTFLYSFVADHYQYVACVGLIALVAAGLERAFDRMQHGRWMVQVVVCGGLLLVLGTLTWRQAETYRDAESLWRATLRRNPASWLAHVNLGIALDSRNQTAEALEHYREAVSLKPDDAKARNKLGIALTRNGQLDQGLEQFQEAVRLQPGDATARNSLGFALAKKGRVDEAIGQLREAMRLNPNDPLPHNSLGVIFEDQDRSDEAIEQYREAIRLKLDYADAYNNLGVALVRKGLVDDALKQYREAIRLEPDYANAHGNLGIALAMRGTTDEAIIQFQEAIRLNPSDADTHNQLGILFGSSGRLTEAIDQFQTAVRLKPESAEAQFNLKHALEMRDGPAGR